nr:MAG TPA: hypothetical protein [Caudoviricetes sp.]
MNIKRITAFFPVREFRQFTRGTLKCIDVLCKKLCK